MDTSVEYIPLTMVRPDLNAIPEMETPSGFRIRTFEPGDERNWATIERLAGEFETVESGLGYFEKEFGPQADKLPERMHFLEHVTAGPVGTTSAWFGDYDGSVRGRIHWVAVVPDFQGKGLSRPLLAAAMRILAAHHETAYLTTQTHSWRAVGLYRSFGFEPVLDSDEARRGWRIIEACLERSRSGSR